NTPLHRWIRHVEAAGFQVRVHILQFNVQPGDLNLFERYWMGQFAGLLNTSNGTPAVAADTAVGVAVRKGLRRHLRQKGAPILGAPPVPSSVATPRPRTASRTATPRGGVRSD